jgi:transposase
MGNPAGVKINRVQRERRRREAARLLKKGRSEAEVARRVGVHRQSVNRWARQLAEGGVAALKRAPRTGRPPQLAATDLRRIEAGLKRGPEALGYRTSLWSAWRVADLIERECGVKYSSVHAWRILRQLGWTPQRPVGRALERNEVAIERWKRERWPTPKKNAEIRGQTIVFVDESGLSERPHRCRTWAPRGQTPVLQYHFRWKTLSMMAGITWWNFYFKLFPGAIKAPQIVEFLTHLLRHLRRPLLVIWDGLPGHHSALVRDFVTAQGGRLTLEFLPGYAPELNPVEYIWAYLKKNELANLCPRELWDLSTAARAGLRRMRRRPTLVRAFWQQAELFD